MPLLRYIWLLLCYANLARSSLMEEFQSLTTDRSPAALTLLPVHLEVNPGSGCNCRSTATNDVTVCFGFYSCTAFPRVISTHQSEKLKVKSTDIKIIAKGDTDEFAEIKYMEIDSNRNLQHIEPLAFRNLSNLEHLSISFNWKLTSLQDGVFVGLNKLNNLTLVSNGFISISHVTRALCPHILPALERLDLSENVFASVSDLDFIPMQDSNLTALELVLCQMEKIHRNSLLPLNKLRYLHIGENNLNSSDIGDMLLALNKADINLHLLDISRMGFRKSPPRTLLEIIANTTIKKLVLAQNQFEFMLNNTFPRMENLELLDLRQVLTVYIEETAFGPSKFPNLKVLLLSGNNLSGLQVRISTRLKHLDISSNMGAVTSPSYFDVAPNTFRNMSNLEVLNLSFNRIVNVYNFTFEGLEQLRILSLKNGSIFSIDPFTFISTPHLEMLNLENNPYLQSNNQLSKNIFTGLNELKVLVMSNCGIQSFADDFFSVFPNLTHLILRSNKIISITSKSLEPLNKLRSLDLSNNFIVSWSSPLFRPSGAPIRRLFLNNNKITRFTLSMLEDMKYILNIESNKSAEVELLGNVFVCDCSSMYVAYSWIAANDSGPLRSFFSDSQFTCTSPAYWEHKTVATYLATYHGVNCSIYHSKMQVIVITLAVIVSILVVVAGGSFIYVYRFYVSYWLFLAKLALGRRRVSSEARLTADKTHYRYDAFVSYSSEDREFVIEMADELEASSPFLKLCVYERDFEIGSFISESIHSSINDSRYIILVVSDHFAKSQWCRWETQLAEYHRLFSDGSPDYDPLILITIGDVQPKHLTPTLKYLLKTKIYLKWEAQEKNSELWNKLRKVLTKKVVN